MRFHSLEFLLFFLPLFFILWKFSKDHLKPYIIAFASLVFYSWGEPRYALLLLISASIDFFLAQQIAGQNKIRFRKFLLFLAIFSNLFILCYFKYFLSPLHSLYPEQQFPLQDLLPIGLSFYIFQSMSYSIDVFYKRTLAEKNFFHYLAYLSLFPQLVAGPICRFTDVMAQIKHHQKPSDNESFEGIKLIILGYFKKLVIADYLSSFVTPAFAKSLPYQNSIYWWLILIAFAYQIYFDFSAYTDIARGLCQLMGIKLKKNFFFPYHATSFSNFWQRWHISLSTWFRDYVYIPLGGSRKGNSRTVLNIWVTMILSGLWHGLGLTYLLWSVQHAFFLNLEKFHFNKKIIKSRYYPMLVFFIVLLSWVWFRSQNLNQSLEVFTILFGFKNLSIHSLLAHKEILLFILLAFLTDKIELLCFKNKIPIPKYFQIFLFLIIFLLTIFFRAAGTDFLYFKF